MHRYRLIDYIYTAFHTAHTDGTPVLNPLWFKYPHDAATYQIDLQFFYGDSILVSPVTEENSTSVTFYLPKDRFYDFATLAPVDGQGASVTLDNVNFTTIPLHIKSGTVLPLRASGTMTTAELRKTDFEFVVAPGLDGQATGSLYIDDGESIVQKATTTVTMAYQNRSLTVAGQFGYHADVKVARVLFLGVDKAPQNVKIEGRGHIGSVPFSYDSKTKVLRAEVAVPLQDFQIHFS